MALTIKELSEKLGVTKTAIRKKLTPEFREKYTESVKNTIYINDEGEKLILESSHAPKKAKEESSKPAVVNETTKEEEQNNDDLVGFLKEQIGRQDKYIEQKDEQIERLQKLLDQSQQLQLMAEKKIEKLEAPKEDDKEKVSSSEEEKGFWKKIFH
ncbi:replication protein B [Oenococcus alcoholitolerans]|uniref:replication protein B n=1 Tax=Oenococcus alcoholitolerans TaxID=931074 RepID=UPI003F726476